MLESLALALGVPAHQLLTPINEVNLRKENAVSAILLKNLKRNIQDDINARFDHLQTHLK